MNNVKLLDCTFRDGGYYNAWDFDCQLVNDYLKAMSALPVQYVEFGFRNMPGKGNKFLGGCAFSTDEYINSFTVPKDLNLAVMVNTADLISYSEGVESAINYLFKPVSQSPVDLVRIACHVHQVEEALPAVVKLKELGYKTTINLMQIAGLPALEIERLAEVVSRSPVDVLYFADSLGGLEQDQISEIVKLLRKSWQGELGFHSHNNMELALSNSARALDEGVTWIDGAVLGMGRGPGNARTEYLAMEFESRFDLNMNHIPLLELIRKYFKPMQQKYNWGPNPFYYLAGKYGIHPTFIQEMLGDSRYDEEDVLAVIENLKEVDGKSYKPTTLANARNFYKSEPLGKWSPEVLLKGKDVFVIGSGPGAAQHKQAIENYILKAKPTVIALNKQAPLTQEYIDLRAACHPVRLLADNSDHLTYPQPLVIPASMLPVHVSSLYNDKEIYDYGLKIENGAFRFYESYGVIPNNLVLSYVLAMANSGKARRLLLAGFDGYGLDDPRTFEVDEMFKTYLSTNSIIPLVSVTPTQYNIPQLSIYDPFLLEG